VGRVPLGIMRGFQWRDVPFGTQSVLLEIPRENFQK